MSDPIDDVRLTAEGIRQIINEYNDSLSTSAIGPREAFARVERKARWADRLISYLSRLAPEQERQWLEREALAQRIHRALEYLSERDVTESMPQSVYEELVIRLRAEADKAKAAYVTPTPKLVGTVTFPPPSAARIMLNEPSEVGRVSVAKPIMRAYTNRFSGGHSQVPDEPTCVRLKSGWCLTHRKFDRDWKTCPCVRCEAVREAAKGQDLSRFRNEHFGTFPECDRGDDGWCKVHRSLSCPTATPGVTDEKSPNCPLPLSGWCEEHRLFHLERRPGVVNTFDSYTLERSDI